MNGSLDLRFLTLTLRNFMSYGNAITTINLDLPGTCQIQGRNLDDTEQGIGANGVGKSTLINALVYVLYGRAMSSDIAVDDLINDVNKQNCMVSCVFKIRHDTYQITRYRKMKTGPESNYVEVLKNDEKLDELNKASIDATNEWIINLLGMPRELFVRLVVYDADEVSFFKLEASKQRLVMENLFQITTLSEKAELAKESNKKSKNELAVEENNIERLLDSIQLHDQQLLKANQRLHAWENDRKVNINTYQNQYVELSKIDVEYERQLIAGYKEVEQKIAELRPIVDAIKNQRSLYTSDVKQYQLKCSNFTQQIKTLHNDRARLVSQSEALKKQIALLQESKCPECGQHLESAQQHAIEKHTQCEKIENEIKNIDTTVSSVEDSIVNIMNDREQIEALITETDKKIQETLLQITTIMDAAIKPNYSSDSELAVIDSKKNNLQEKIISLQQQTNPHLEVVNDLQQVSPPNVNYDNINHLKKVIDHQTFLIKLLTDKKSFIRRNLIQKRLPLLNEKLSKYLKQMGLPFKVEFNSDLTPSIKRRGQSLGFGSLSHGQKARVNFALSFAFRDVQESMSRRINICMLDEVLDKALCGVGANAAVNMINEKAKEDKISIFVITHKSELSNRFHRQMIVTMENGFSSIQQ